MSTKNEIANMAIGHLGIGKSVVDFDTDRTSEADALRKYYDVARDSTLRDLDWPFAHKIAALSLVEEDPTEDWKFSYTYPSDCLKFLKIRVTSQRVDSFDNRVPYKLIHGTNSTLIYTDMEDAVGEYTVGVTDEERFAPDFVMAFSYKLAMYISARVTGGNASALLANVQKMYFYHLSIAQENAKNEDGVDILPESEFVRARD